MNQDDLRQFERRCTQDSPPRCQARCPLHVDVRGFVAEMRRGQYQAARTILERQLPLPAILGRVCDHPCEDDCLRRDLGGPIAVGDLERHCFEKAAQGAKGLPRPKKAKKVAVLGAGPAALTVAWDLAGKGYPISVFHADGDRDADVRRIVGASLSGRGLDFAAVLPDAIIAEEMARLEKRGTAFQQRQTDEALLDECRRQFDAVFVDAACAPQLCPPPESLNPVTGSLEDFSLCFGGWGDSLVGMAFEGRRAGVTLDRVLGGTSALGAREGEGPQETCLYTPLEGIPPAERTADAVAEAERCLLCECMACVRECAYLKHFQSYPKAYARQVFLNVTMVKGHRLANKLINSCTLCGQCREICPQDFSMAELCLRGRRELVAKGHMPPSAHEFALNDMDQANGGDCRLARPDPRGRGCDRVFFLGCQLAASRGEQVRIVYRHLLDHMSGGTGIWLGCCGAPAAWAGRDQLLADVAAATIRTWEELGRPEIIAACSSCLSIFRTATPEIPTRSLWEVLEHEAPPPEPVEHIQLRLAVNDPCTARHDEAWLRSVRRLAVRQGVELVEPRMTRDTSSCCGYGGLVWNANPEVADAMAMHRTEELAEEPLSSCIMCRDRLVAVGRPGRHLLDVLWPESAVDPHTPGPRLSARRFGRAQLRKDVLKEFYNGSQEETEPAKRMDIVIPEEILARLEGRHILVEDVEQVIAAAESGGQRFVDRQSGRTLTARRLGNVTFWVEFTGPDGGPYTVHDAYCHRMVVPGPSTGAAAERLP